MDIIRIIAISLSPVALTAALCALQRFTAFGKIKKLYQQIIIGVLFGAVACAGTEFGIPVGDAVINVRDASPVCATFIFGGPSGIIAAVIGAAERYISGMLGNGEFTALACSISTLLAGVAATLVKVFLTNNKKPSLLFSAAFSVVMEGMHMFVILLTNVDEMSRAHKVVSSVFLIMAAANTAAILASVFASVFVSGDKSYWKQTRSISNIIERGLIIVVSVVFILGEILSMVMFSLNVSEDIRDDFTTHLHNYEKQLKEFLIVNAEKDLWNEMVFRPNLHNVTEEDIVSASGSDKLSSDAVNNYLEGLREGFTSNMPAEINLVASDNTIINSTSASNIGLQAVRNEEQPDSSDEPFFDGLFFDETTKMYYTLELPEETYLGKLGNLQVMFDYNYIFFESMKYFNGESTRYYYNSSDYIRVYMKSETEDGYYEITQSKAGENNFNADGYDDLSLHVVEINGVKIFRMLTRVDKYVIVAQTDYDAATEEIRISLTIDVFIKMIIFTSLFIAVDLLVKKKVIKKVGDITKTLSKISGGNLDVEVNVRSSGEFASLSDDINATVDKMKSLIKAEAARIDKDLALARAIQSSSLPEIFPPYPDIKEFDVYAMMLPAKEVGGDFYDFFMIDHSHFAFTVADVSGKGIPAALFMMTAKTMLKNLVLQNGELDEAFNQANQMLCETNSSQMFVTVWMGVLDLKSGVVRFVNAGHNSPLVRRNGRLEYLKKRTGFVLSALKKSRYRYEEIQLSAGDELLLYTDGVTEGRNADKEFYGEDRLFRTVSADNGEDVRKLCESVRADVEGFVGNAEQFDDITLLAVRYNGEQNTVHTERSFTASAESTAQAKDFLRSFLEENGADSKTVTKACVVLDEMFSNIVKFAYPQGTGEAELEINIDARGITLTFTDSGVPFNPLEHVNPEIENLHASERKIGGLGIYMIKKIASVLDYKRDGGKNIFSVTL